MKHKIGEKRWDLISSVDDFDPANEIKFRNPNIIRYKRSVFVSPTYFICLHRALTLFCSLYLSSLTILTLSSHHRHHRSSASLTTTQPKFLPLFRTAINNTNFFLQGFPRPYSTNIPSFEVEEIWVWIGFVEWTWIGFFIFYFFYQTFMLWLRLEFLFSILNLVCSLF